MGIARLVLLAFRRHSASGILVIRWRIAPAIPMPSAAKAAAPAMLFGIAVTARWPTAMSQLTPFLAPIALAAGAFLTRSAGIVDPILSPSLVFQARFPQ